MCAAEEGAVRDVRGPSIVIQPPTEAQGGTTLLDGAAPSVSSETRNLDRKQLAVYVLPRLALVCLAAYCVIGTVKMTSLALRFLPNQRENAYTESPHVYVALKAAQTGRLYFPLSQPPYVLQSYGPLFYVVNAAIARLSHLDADPTRMHIRAFSFACFLCSALLVLLIARRLRFSWLSALLAALALLAQPLFFPWNDTVRPDLPCLAAMLLGLYLAIGAEEGWGDWAFAVSGALAGCAFLIKQPGIVCGIAIVTVLAIHKRFRQAIYVVFGAVVPTALIFGFLLLRHEPFLEQFTTVGKSVWSRASGAQFAVVAIGNISVLAPLAIGVIGLFSVTKRQIGTHMLASFAFASWAVGLSGLPQLGADVNYLLPGLGACALLLPLAMQTVQRKLQSIVVLVVIVLALGQAIFGVVRAASIDSYLALNLERNPYAALHPYRILSDAPIFALHGRDPDLLDPFSTHALELAGHWASAPIAENVRNSTYDLIVLNCSRPGQPICGFRKVAFLSPSVVQAINANYEILCSTMSGTVLTPRSRVVNATPELFAAALGARCGTGLRGHPPNLFLPEGAR